MPRLPEKHAISSVVRLVAADKIRGTKQIEKTRHGRMQNGGGLSRRIRETKEGADAADGRALEKLGVVTTSLFSVDSMR